MKRGVASLLHGVGLTSLSFALQRAYLSPFVRVLYYHDVQPWLADRFEKQLARLKQLFVPASKSDLEALVRSGRWPHERPGVILTFDDGLRSHAEVVAPLLDKHKFQGWFFVPADLVTMPAAEQPQAAVRHSVLHDCDTASDPRVFMTGRQVAALANRHIVGCHTATHVRLSKELTERELVNELERAQQRLQGLLGGQRVDSFSWVGGEEWAYSEAAARIVARLFDYAFTTNTCVTRPGTPRLNIARTHMECSFSPSLVELQLSGMMDVYYRSKRRRLSTCLAPCSSAAALEGFRRRTAYWEISNVKLKRALKRVVPITIADLVRSAGVAHRLGLLFPWLATWRYIGRKARFGSQYGGWVIPRGRLTAQSVCYCVGCGEDISFDRELIRRYSCPVYGFDPTPRSVEFVRRTTADVPAYRFSDVGLWDSDGTVRFFAPRDSTHVSHSITNLQGTDSYIEVQTRRLRGVLRDNGHSGLALLKLDIEGAENTVIRTILEDAIPIDLLLIEFDELGFPTPERLARINESIQALLGAGYRLFNISRSNFTFVRSVSERARGGSSETISSPATTGLPRPTAR